MKATGIGGTLSAEAARAAYRRELVDLNVKDFARITADMASLKGVHVRAEASLGQNPSVRFTVGSDADATAVRALFTDQDFMDVNGLSGTADFSGPRPRYADQAVLREGVPFSIEVGKLAPPPPTVPVEHPHRVGGWQNNLGPDGVARAPTRQELVQANRNELGHTLIALAVENGIRARVELDGAIGLRIIVPDQAATDQLAKLLLDPKQREDSSYLGTLEAAGPGLFRYADIDSGMLKHGVPIEVKVGSLQPRQVEY